MRALEGEPRAGAGAAAVGLFEAVPGLPAGREGPDARGEEPEDVRAADQPDQPALAEDGEPSNALSGQQTRGLVDARFLGDRDHVGRHDVTGRAALLGEDVELGDDPHHEALRRHHGRAGDVALGQRAGDLLDRRVFIKGDHVGGHDVLDRGHCVRSSLVTRLGSALPPERLIALGPADSGSLPARCAASGSAPVGSSASFSLSQAIRVASAISSSLTVAMPSTRPWVTMTSKERPPIATGRTPSAMVAGESGSCWICPVFSVRAASSARSGSTPTTRSRGPRALAARALPLRRPPPPHGVTSRPIEGSSSRSSRAAVPWPWTTSQSSKGWTSVRPRACITSRIRSSRLVKVIPA